jgi:rfaE bifunctional protein nucleotidyltransferase chain/domain
LKTKILSLTDLAGLAGESRRKGQRLVLTNGCFDLLHVGHVRYLQKAQRLGDVLVVAMNDDESVRALKGPGRPINSAEDRAEVLSALDCVDFVTIFSEPQATKVIEATCPAVYVKGGDYTIESLNAQELAALRHCETAVKILPLVPGKSTSQLVAKMQDC